jgi:hypothetical protein
MTKPPWHVLGSSFRAEGLAPKPKICALIVQSAGFSAFLDKSSWFLGDFGHTHPLSAIPSETCFTLGLPHRGLSTSQSPVKGLECAKRPAMKAENQFQATTGLDQCHGQGHELVNHGPGAAPLGGIARRSFCVHKPNPPNSAQDVVGRCPKVQGQSVGGGFTRREPFHVHGGFDLTAELFTPSMILMKPDHVIFGQIQSGPPSFQLAPLRWMWSRPMPSLAALMGKGAAALAGSELSWFTHNPTTAGPEREVWNSLSDGTMMKRVRLHFPSGFGRDEHIYHKH